MNKLNAEDQHKLEALRQKIKENSQNSLGYPVSKDFDYSELFELLKYPVNNIGDPFADCTYSVDSREMEREVLEFFAEVFRAQKNDWWGYVTNGGSEGNMYGLYMARELHPKGMVYYSAATHYSVHKNLHLLDMPNIVIRAQKNGEIDYEDLSNTIRMNRHMPVIIMANIGTTMTEAKDDITKIKAILNDAAIQNYYIHCDGALSGTMSPFLNPRPAFDFADGADSIAISGHKFIGSPIPSGVLLVKKSHRDRIGRSVAYIGSLDTTITGSRNGHSPLFLWYAIKTLGLEGFKKRVDHSLSVAAYAENRLKSIGLDAWRNQNAITVVFPQPHEIVRKKWQLASERGLSHIICMPNVTESQIDELILDIEKYREAVLS
ncbi:histidine decarboxylase [Solitalea canadensis]|uniref:PLP-dependent enzyme, glutamate decarboxylase n=1 Tax=Solitalea canadensis (strain ATCC 29591 / DSM 3403 / JCM 21819 / LMG 8368 / NBRC 15130 / NCIMB 12057 / USAM 9D) TaxID=929556 RepID=H8KRC7_SOLCM|nr:histidine decarboxylase [Solitalea canadensis]AFD07394.1 PLP-dependent enzyme, glutamate decarboxylase [Solitalea canadensis DSM 3403]